MMWRIASAALALALIAAAIPAVRHVREKPPPPEPPVLLTLAPPAGAEFGSPDLTLDLAIAPSGSELAFAAATSGELQLWRRAIDADEASPIAGTAGATMPAYSPDGSTIWFFADGKLRTVAASDGARRDVADAPSPGGVSIRADAAVLAAPGPGPIKRLERGSLADATTLRAGERSHAFPSWTGTGDSFVYLATLENGRRILRLRDAEADVELAQSDSHGVVVAGVVAYVREGTLRAEPLDPSARRRQPTARTLATDVGVSATGRGSFALSERLLIWAMSARRSGVLRWFLPDGSALPPLAEPGDLWQVRLSPDDRTAAITVRDPLLRTLDIFTLPASGGYPGPLTRALAADTDPVWSPDGRRIAFRSSQEGQPQIFVGQPLKGVIEEIFFRSPLDEVPTDWTATDLIFHARAPETGFDIWRIPHSAREGSRVIKSTFNEVDGRVSPDGRWIAYASDESGQLEVYVSRLADFSDRIRVSTAGGAKPQWTAGGTALVFRRGDDFMRATVQSTGGSLQTTVPVRLLTLQGVRDAAIAQDGTRLLAIVPSDRSVKTTVHALVNWATSRNRP